MAQRLLSGPVARKAAQLDLFPTPPGQSKIIESAKASWSQQQSRAKIDYFTWVQSSHLRPGLSKVVMLVLAARADAEGSCRYSLRALSDEVGLSTTRVRFHIDCLVSSSTLLLKPWIDPRYGTQLGFIFRIVRTIAERIAALAVGFEPIRRSKFEKADRVFRPPLRIVGR